MDLMEIRRRILSNSSQLPPMYKSVDYIVSTGQNSFIDTGVSGDDDTLSFECTFMVMELWGYAGIFGNYTASGQKAWRLIQGTASTWLYTNCHTSNGNVLYIPGNNFLGVKLTVTVDTTGSVCTKDGESRTSTTGAKAGTETGQNIAAGRHAITTASNTQTQQTRFYGFKIMRGSQLIRNYVPCLRIKDDIAGLWDKVNKRFQPSDTIYNFGYGYDT